MAIISTPELMNDAGGRTSDFVGYQSIESDLSCSDVLVKLVLLEAFHGSPAVFS